MRRKKYLGQTDRGKTVYPPPPPPPSGIDSGGIKIHTNNTEQLKTDPQRK